MKLLLVEDEIELSNAVAKILKYSNYTVDQAFDGKEALEFIDVRSYDAIIMDIMMPRIDGLTVLKTLRENKNFTPVLLLTAKAEIDDKIIGLDCGADDYLTKPFAMKELLARIRAITRRVGNINEGLTIGNISIDRDNFMLKTNDGEINLTNTEFRLIELLIRNKERLLSTDVIMESVWDFESEAEINVVWVYISSLRKKLEKVKANIIIKAVRGVGYKLEIKND